MTGRRLGAITAALLSTGVLFTTLGCQSSGETPHHGLGRHVNASDCIPAGSLPPVDTITQALQVGRVGVTCPTG